MDLPDSVGYSLRVDYKDEYKPGRSHTIRKATGDSILVKWKELIPQNTNSGDMTMARRLSRINIISVLYS